MLSKYVKGRVAVYIDAANVHYSCKRLKWKIDYKKLLDYLKKETQLVGLSFYSAKDSSHLRQQKFLDFLEIIGYRVRSKEVKFIKTPDPSVPEVGFHKGNLDIELTIDVLDDCDTFDTLILVSGDSDFAPLLKKMKKMGKWCVVISTKGHIAKELIIEAKFIDFKKLKSQIEKL